MPIDALNNFKGSSVTVNKDIQPRPVTTGKSPESVPVSASQDQVVHSLGKPQGIHNDPEQLAQAATHVQQHFQSITRELQFMVDEDSGKTVITVLDSETGEKIRQIPSEEILEISRAITEVMDEFPDHVPSVLIDEKV